MKKQERFEEPKDRKSPADRNPNSPSGETDPDIDDLEDRDEEENEYREPEKPTGTDPRRRGQSH
ncbi:MAG TPA: hypothetical protein VFW45_03205 [Candidatus Polarisedimenticolia bacterium]|nr:hypothetical protein [Candidatus Polarisedimenticolia bacterium]